MEGTSSISEPLPSCAWAVLPLNFPVTGINKCSEAQLAWLVCHLKRRKKIILTDMQEFLKVTRLKYTKSLCRKISLFI